MVWLTSHRCFEWMCVLCIDVVVAHNVCQGMGAHVNIFEPFTFDCVTGTTYDASAVLKDINLSPGGSGVGCCR